MSGLVKHFFKDALKTLEGRFFLRHLFSANTGLTQEDRKLSQHVRKFVDCYIKHQHKQNHREPSGSVVECLT